MAGPVTGDRVQVVGRHPHTGEWGTLGAQFPGKYWWWAAAAMWHIALEDCQHGVAACYAAAKNLRPEPKADG